MDFNLGNISVCDYNKQIKTKASVEADIIVPDTKPDIGRILSVKAIADVSERYMRKDKVIFSGKVKFNILYVGDGDPSAMCSIEYSSPFNHQADMPGADDSAISIGSCNVSRTVFDVKNSRKLSVGAILELKAEAVRQSSLEAISGDNQFPDTPSHSMNCSSDFLAACQEFEINLSDCMTLVSNSENCEVYDVTIRPDIIEIKTVNNKAIVKGNANIGVLYGDAGEICSYDTEATFTEIIDIDSVSAEHMISSHFEVADSSYALSVSDAGNQLDVDFKLRGSICAFEHSNFCLASDIYSPDYNYDTKSRNASIMHISKCNKTQTTLKDSIILSSADPAVSKIYYMDAMVGHSSVQNDGSVVKVSGSVETVVVYADEEKNLCRIHHNTPFETELTADTEGAYSMVNVEVACVNYGYMLASSREIQIRAIINAEGKLTDLEDISLITDFALDADSPIDKASQPSIVVYYPDSNSDIWDIAKKYNTTCEEIIKLNSLDSYSLKSGDKPILIPKRQINRQ